MTEDIENTSLPAHVRLCQERYDGLKNSLKRGDRRMARIEKILWCVVGLLVVLNIPGAADLLAIAGKIL